MNIQKPESDAKSQREADRDDHGVQESADAADVMAIDKVTDSVAERNSRDEIKDTCGKGYLRGLSPAEDKA